MLSRFAGHPMFIFYLNNQVPNKGAIALNYQPRHIYSTIFQNFGFTGKSYLAIAYIGRLIALRL